MPLQLNRSDLGNRFRLRYSDKCFGVAAWPNGRPFEPSLPQCSELWRRNPRFECTSISPLDCAASAIFLRPGRTDLHRVRIRGTKRDVRHSECSIEPIGQRLIHVHFAVPTSTPATIHTRAPQNSPSPHRCIPLRPVRKFSMALEASASSLGQWDSALAGMIERTISRSDGKHSEGTSGIRCQGSHSHEI